MSPVEKRPRRKPVPVPPKPEPTPEPEPNPVPTPAPATTIGAPTGTVPRGNIAGGGKWSTVNRFDTTFVAEGKKHKVDPAMLKSMMIVESGGQSNASGAGGASGIMQIKPQYWRTRAEAAGYDIDTDVGQIGMAAAILGGSVPGTRGTTPMERFVYTYYPVLNSDGSVAWDTKGESGHTPRMYVDDIAMYTKLINEAAGGKPEKPIVKDLLLLIFGEPYTITQEWANLGPSADLYGYGAGRNPQLHGAEHPGIDAIGRSGKGGPLYAPFAGQVVCAGTGVGRGAWGTGCAAFNDYTEGGGAGRIELLHPDGKRSLLFGHCDTATVAAGAQVAAGKKVATVGGMRGDHVHIEGRRWDGSDYGIYDPRKLFADITGGVPEVYAQRLPIPQPSAFDVFWTATAARDDVPVLQRADLNSEPVRWPLKKGEEVEFVYLVIGNDKNTYAVSRLGSRIPVSGLVLPDALLNQIRKPT